MPPPSPQHLETLARRGAVVGHILDEVVPMAVDMVKTLLSLDINRERCVPAHDRTAEHATAAQAGDECGARRVVNIDGHQQHDLAGCRVAWERCRELRKGIFRLALLAGNGGSRVAREGDRGGCSQCDHHVCEPESSRRTRRAYGQHAAALASRRGRRHALSRRPRRSDCSRAATGGRAAVSLSPEEKDGAGSWEARAGNGQQRTRLAAP